MSLYGITKETELEEQIDRFLELETRAVSMYHGLARLAKERGLDDVAEGLIRVANDEARHAGLYAVLNAHVPSDIFAVLGNVAEMEANSEKGIKAFAQKVRDSGFDEAAQEIEAAAEDEGRHGRTLQELLKKHGKK
jgi:rubrerythrin